MIKSRQKRLLMRLLMRGSYLALHEAHKDAVKHRIAIINLQLDEFAHLGATLLQRVLQTGQLGLLRAQLLLACWVRH